MTNCPQKDFNRSGIFSVWNHPQEEQPNATLCFHQDERRELYPACETCDCEWSVEQKGLNLKSNIVTLFSEETQLSTQRMKQHYGSPVLRELSSAPDVYLYISIKVL